MSVARALYAFEGSETGDLSFQEDDIIRILRKVRRKSYSLVLPFFSSSPFFGSAIISN